MWKSSKLGLEGQVNGKRDRGRQRITWGNDVKEWTNTRSIRTAKRVTTPSFLIGTVKD